jgi:hypothetical protein
VYTVNNPLRYVDPTGEDWWNPFRGAERRRCAKTLRL